MRPPTALHALYAASLSEKARWASRSSSSGRRIDRDYYRMRWDGGIALYRSAEENSWVYTEAGDPWSTSGA
jgi:hypothetical protein